ncbi:flavin reductase family protein [Fodinicurvata sp. EGI_FJ10296]|uniref:flavin reductase family protein n=1 Tax=Fodinicurvata sp. EGI_FJ10296 TaxID=3231908 RepID=UPI003452B1E8
MHFAPGAEACPLPFDPFKACTVPRPIGWLSTVSGAGQHNLAPYSQWQNLTYDPPMVMLAANQSVLGGRKDSVRNIEETGWFVWNMATWDLREAVNISAMALPHGVDEFERAGLDTLPSVDAPCLRVAQSPCHFECKYVTTLRLPGKTDVGTTDLIVGEVVRIHVNDDALTPEGKLDVLKIRPIARLGYYDYTVIDNIFEMRIPESTEAEAAGLEGRRRGG